MFIEFVCIAMINSYAVYDKAAIKMSTRSTGKTIFILITDVYFKSFQSTCLFSHISANVYVSSKVLSWLMKKKT